MVKCRSSASKRKAAVQEGQSYSWALKDPVETEGASLAAENTAVKDVTNESDSMNLETRNQDGSADAATSSRITIQELQEKYASLLVDTSGQPRAAFLEISPSIIRVLQEAWNLDRNMSQATRTRDQVSRRLMPVQSYFPNLLNYAVESPGFPIMGSGSEIFSSLGQERVAQAELELQFTLAEKLSEMGYMTQDQTLTFHLSFLRTRNESKAQDPHVDFPWGKVVDNDKKENPNGSPNTSLSRGSPRHRRLPYKMRVPFAAFFPLSESGMVLEIWKARPNPEKMVSKETTTMETNEVDHEVGVLVDFPLGVLLLARGDVVHAGGFMTGPKPCRDLVPLSDEPLPPDHQSWGDPRGHLYIYRSGGEVHEVNLKNSYYFATTVGNPKKRKQSSMPLHLVYKHALGIDTVTTDSHNWSTSFPQQLPPLQIPNTETNNNTLVEELT